VRHRDMATEEGLRHELWRQRRSKLGIQGLVVPEGAQGGSGAGHAASSASLMQELGRPWPACRFSYRRSLATRELLESGEADVHTDILERSRRMRRHDEHWPG